MKIDGVESLGRMFGSSLKQPDGSIRVEGLNLLTLAHNKRLSIARSDGQFPCYSRSVHRCDDGTLALQGYLDRPHKRDAPQTAMLLNCYIRLESSVIICMPVEFEDDAMARVQLWDNMQFRIPQTSLSGMTRVERYQSLGQEDNLQAACETYGFRRTDAQQDRNRVFLFEFGEIEDCPVIESQLNDDFVDI